MKTRFLSFILLILCFCGYAFAQNQGIEFTETFSKQCFAEGDVWTHQFVIRNTGNAAQLVQADFLLQDSRVENVFLGSQIVSISNATLITQVTTVFDDAYYFQMLPNSEITLRASFRIDKLVISSVRATYIGAVFLNYQMISDGFPSNFDVCPVEQFSMMDCEPPRQVQLPQINAQSYCLLAPPLLPEASVTLSARGVLTYTAPQVSQPMQDRINYEIIKTDGTTFTGQIDVEVVHCIEVKTENTPTEYCDGDCEYSGPSILINEVMHTPQHYNGAIFGTMCGSNQLVGGEWVELYNPDTCNAVDISGYFFANSTEDALSNGSGSCVAARNLGSAFVLPEGTIVPPNGFAVLRGERAVLVDEARLVENGGSTVVINLVDHFDRFCYEGDRFWLPDRGGWFGFYDRNGVPQDAIYWGLPQYLCEDCTPCNPQIAGSFAGTLGSLNDFPNNRKTRVSDFDATRMHFGLSPKRIPDGAAWTFNNYTEPTIGYCNATCNQRVSSNCNGTATVTPLDPSGNYSYQWNDPQAQTTATATGLCEGTYCCTITDNAFPRSTIVCVTVPRSASSETIVHYIRPGESYRFGNQLLTEEGIYEQHLRTVNGCDSLVTLDLRLDLPQCMRDGRLLFKEDFGGNSPDDPLFSTTPLPQSTYTFATNGDPRDSSGNGRYALRKISYSNGAYWYSPFGDHTSPNDDTRGYLMQIDASSRPGTFYETQIDDLCSGTELYFSIWGLSSIRSGSFANANLKLLITNTSRTELASQNITLQNLRGYWEQFGMPFTVPAGETSIIFSIINNSTASMGNDFMLDDIEIYLCAPAVTIDNVTVCSGSEAILKGEFQNDGTFVEPLVYRWQKSQTGDMENPDWVNVGTNSNELIFASVQTANAGYYRLLIGNAGTIDSENCRVVSEPAYLTVNTPTQTNLTGTICEGESYDFYGRILTTGGVYTHTLQNANSCDNIITLTLTVNPLERTSVSAAICEGGSYNFYGRTLTTGGAYTHTLQTVYGCDSIIALTLTINPLERTSVSAAICEGESYNFYGRTLTTGGAYTHTLQTVYGCDSIIALTLTVNPLERTSVSAAICEGESYNFYGRPLTTGGVYTHTLQNANSCDNIVTLTLTINPLERTSVSAAICEGESYDFYGRALTTSGVYTHTLQNVNSCNNIVTLTLNVISTDYTRLDVTIRDTETYLFAGQRLNQSGTYTDRQKNIHGCDSIIVLNLRVLSGVIAPPEVFTPNDDGQNDIFEIPNLELYPNNSILIFNRWGNKVFEASPYLNNWDGRNYFGLRIGGDRLPAGTYFYILNLGDGTEPRKGYVYIAVE